MKSFLVTLLLLMNTVVANGFVFQNEAIDDMPEYINKWIDGELSKARNKTLIQLDSDTFFSKDSARIFGYIKNFSPSEEVSTEIILMDNSITGEDIPVVVKIYTDGRFVVFLFITSDDESPLSAYESFVKNQELQHSYRITFNDYKYLRELFKFNGIPRYVVIGKDGKVLDDNFNIHNFKDMLE